MLSFLKLFEKLHLPVKLVIFAAAVYLMVVITGTKISMHLFFFVLQYYHRGLKEQKMVSAKIF